MSHHHIRYKIDLVLQSVDALDDSLALQHGFLAQLQVMMDALCSCPGLLVHAHLDSRQL